MQICHRCEVSFLFLNVFLCAHVMWLCDAQPYAHVNTHTHKYARGHANTRSRDFFPSGMVNIFLVWIRTKDNTNMYVCVYIYIYIWLSSAIVLISEDARACVHARTHTHTHVETDLTKYHRLLTWPSIVFYPTVCLYVYYEMRFFFSSFFLLLSPLYLLQWSLSYFCFLNTSGILFFLYSGNVFIFSDLPLLCLPSYFFWYFCLESMCILQCFHVPVTMFSCTFWQS